MVRARPDARLSARSQVPCRVTAIATSTENPDMILTASRDKTIIVWQITRDEVGFISTMGSPRAPDIGRTDTDGRATIRVKGKSGRLEKRREGAAIGRQACRKKLVGGRAQGEGRGAGVGSRKGTE